MSGRALLSSELAKISLFRRTLLEIQGPVSRAEKVSDGLAIVRIDRDAGTYGDGRLVAIRAQSFGNSIGNAQRRLGVRFGENKYEFVSAVARGNVDCPAMNAKNVCQPADSFCSHEMTVGVIDFLQPVQIGHHDGEGRAVRS